MSTINNLAVSLSEMSEERLFEFIRTLRNNRRVSIMTSAPRKSSTKSSARTIDVNALLMSMSDSDRETLLQILEEKQDDEL